MAAFQIHEIKSPIHRWKVIVLLKILLSPNYEEDFSGRLLACSKARNEWASVFNTLLCWPENYDFWWGSRLSSWLVDGAFLLNPHKAFPQGLNLETVISLVSLPIKTLILWDHRPTHMTSFNLVLLCWCLSFKRFLWR